VEDSSSNNTQRSDFFDIYGPQVTLLLHFTFDFLFISFLNFLSLLIPAPSTDYSLIYLKKKRKVVFACFGDKCGV